MKAKKSVLASLFLLLGLNLFSCCSSKSEELKHFEDGKMIHKKSIPHGSADVKATVMNYLEENNFIKTKLKIEEVYEYGAGTQPLPVGTLLDISIPKSEFNNLSIKPKNGETISLRISVNRSFNKNTSADWKYVMLINN